MEALDFKKARRSHLEVHSKRVMALHFHNKAKVLFSIGEDSFLRVTCLQSMTVMSEVLVSPSASKLTCMKVHNLSNTGVISTREGKIYFLDMFGNPPKVINTISLPGENSVIRGLEMDFF